jgi:hypothetical protein
MNRFVPLDQRIVPAVRTWQGDVNSDFGTAGNWSDDSIPGVNDTFKFDNTAQNDCVITGAAATHRRGR